MAHVTDSREAYNAKGVEWLLVLLHTLSDGTPGQQGAHPIRGLTSDYMTPSNHTIQNIPGGQIIFDDELVTEPSAKLFDAAAWGTRATAHSEGRSTVWRVQVQKGCWLLKHYWRGGLVARWVSRRYWFFGFGSTRMIREYRLIADLYDAGLPVPRPVAALTQRHLILFYSGSLLTEYLEGSQSLASRIRSGAANETPWEAVGAMIRRFHDEGVIHNDLNASNILIGPDQIYLIDFDKGRRVTGSSDTIWKEINLRRLRRSLDKLFESDGSIEDFWARLGEGYSSLR